MARTPDPHQSSRDVCAFCGQHTLKTFMDFGSVALAGGFLKPDQFEAEQRYPMRLGFCETCYAVQLRDVVDPGILFENYFYFSSAIRTLREHFVDYATEVTSRFLETSDASVLEIGCNDGILLKPLADQGVKTVIGVDPAANIINAIDDPRVITINDFFTADVAQNVREMHGPMDMIVANNVFAHIPDINGTTQNIRDLLTDDGVFIFEVHYVGNVLNEFQYDMIYHEHLYYFSLLSAVNHFERFDMEVFDVKPVNIHAGSMRYYVRKKDGLANITPSPRVAAIKQTERDQGLDKAETFARFAADVNARKDQLMELLVRLRKGGKTIAGYGASGRANTVIQYCGITDDHISYMIDDAPSKEGFHTPGSHFPIRGNDVLDKDPPDYILLFAWSYFNEIAKKCSRYFETGGRMIVPLPEVRVVMQPSGESEL